MPIANSLFWEVVASGLAGQPNRQISLFSASHISISAEMINKKHRRNWEEFMRFFFL